MTYNSVPILRKDRCLWLCFRLFRKIKCEKLTLEQQKQICRYVDGQKGYKVVCGGVSCIFEFEAYEFCGHDPDSSDDDVAYGERSAEPEMAIGDSTPGRDWEDFDDSGAGHVQIVRGTDVVRTVAVDMEPSRSPEELETSSHSSRPLSGHVEALAYQQRSISGMNRIMFPCQLKYDGSKGLLGRGGGRIKTSF